MIFETPSSLAVMKFVLLATIAVGVSGGILAWRERPQPGAVPLTILLAGQSWWSATLFFRITATGLDHKIFWVDVSWAGVAIIPVAWLLFALEYTGYTQFLKTHYIALISIVPLVTMILGVTNDYHSLLYTESMLVEQSGVPILDRTPGTWFWVIAGYTYLLGLAGLIPLLEFVSSRVGTFKGQSLLLLLGLFAPWVTNVLFLMDALPTGGIDPTPVGFAISGVAYLSALTQYQLFGTNPTPIRQARRTIFGRMHEGALVLDRNDNVVDMNSRAADIVGENPTTVLGEPMHETLPDLASLIDDQVESEQTGESDSSSSGRTVFHPDTDRKGYDVTTSDLVDTRDRVIGRVVTLHDISDYLRQQQRLEVLHRGFRHNLRTNLQVILGNIDLVADPHGDAATTMRRHAWEIEKLSEKVRTLLEVFEQRRKLSHPVELSSILRDHIVWVRNEYPDVTITSDFAGGDIFVDDVLQEVFLNAIENAAKHNTNPDPEVRIDVETDDGFVRTVITDNGPGIDDQELALVRDGTETPLQHGSGFGLALIVWGTEIAGGTVDITENEQSGVSVTIEVPIRSKSVEERSASRSTKQEPARAEL